MCTNCTNVADHVAANIDKLAPHDVKFAMDLVKQYRRRRGQLSFKQMTWLNIFNDRVSNNSNAPARVDMGTFDGIFRMFENAKKHLKFPKIRLQTAFGQEVCLSLAGPRSKYVGQIFVTDGGYYGQNKYFGRVDEKGVFTKGFKEFDTDAEVLELLNALATDAEGTAAAFGHLYGRCCFCNHGLKDERSTSVGFGPICADHYGLKFMWGQK